MAPRSRRNTAVVSRTKTRVAIPSRKGVSLNPRKISSATARIAKRIAELEEFNAMVAHDLRAPLGAVAMKLDYIIEHGAEHLPERLAGFLNSAAQTTHRAIALVQGLYNLAKFGEGKISLERVSLQTLIGELLDEIGDVQQVAVEVEVLPIVSAHRALLADLFYNLLVNAIVHADKRCPQIRVFQHTAKREREVVLVVADNGAGVAATHGSSPGKGLGLGLIIVQRIAKALRGRFSLSRVDGWTWAAVTLRR